MSLVESLRFDQTAPKFQMKEANDIENIAIVLLFQNYIKMPYKAKKSLKNDKITCRPYLPIMAAEID